jgi:recombinational DNA repair ATPase RecF
MTDSTHFTSVRFRRYKAFRDYSLSFRRFNILVGPNNSGKSTVLGAFRILAEGIRKASARNPVLITGPQGLTQGYSVDRVCDKFMGTVFMPLPGSPKNLPTDYS